MKIFKGLINFKGNLKTVYSDKSSVEEFDGTILDIYEARYSPAATTTNFSKKYTGVKSLNLTDIYEARYSPNVGDIQSSNLLS